jgi:hypothetical protein
VFSGGGQAGFFHAAILARNPIHPQGQGFLKVENF